jgi:hypothetical protein
VGHIRFLLNHESFTGAALISWDMGRGNGWLHDDPELPAAYLRLPDGAAAALHFEAEGGHHGVTFALPSPAPSHCVLEGFRKKNHDKIVKGNCMNGIYIVCIL